MQLKITVLEGDGIGPEVTREAVRALHATADLNGHKFQFTAGQIGGDAIKESGTPLPRATLDMCMASDAVLLGAVGSPEFDLLPAAQRPEAGLLLLRRALGNYANLRPAIAYEAIASSSPLRPEIARDADILIVRELLGGLYFGEPRGIRDDNGNSVATNTMNYSTHEIERVARAAFDAALRRKKKVTSVDKANVLEVSQLWRRIVSEVALDYPDVMLEHLYVDACAMHLITNPKRLLLPARLACSVRPASVVRWDSTSPCMVPHRTLSDKVSQIPWALSLRPRCCFVTRESSSRKLKTLRKQLGLS
jgi:3-isopropylmalate dehydrogenase